jgi:hypothetical protein
MKALEIPTPLKIWWQDFKGSHDWVVRYMHHKRLAHHQRTTLVQKLPTYYPEELHTSAIQVIYAKSIITSWER